MKKSFTLLLLVSISTLTAMGQHLVTGTVMDENSQPFSGVSVQIKGTTTGTLTDADGKYAIRAEKGKVLVFSFVGKITEERVVGEKDVINVYLKTKAASLDQVVVVGYGTQKKADLTGAVANIDVEKTLGSRPITDVGRGLQGVTPGLTITTASGDLGKNPTISLRGLKGSLNGDGAKPLILLDNVEIQDLQMVNPDDVESISVLKDAASASIYGTRAAWGVILITTKLGKKGAPNRVTYTNNFSWSTPTTNPKIASGPAGAEMALAAVRRRVPNLQNYGILGAYYDDESVQKMREWNEQYGGQDLSSEMVEGRDFEIRGGHLFFYRPWDIQSLFLEKYAPQQKHNVTISGGSDKTSYNLGLGYLGEKGVLKVNPDEFDRYNVSLGINSTVTKWFSARGKMILSNTLTTYPYFRLNPATEPWFNLYRYPETFPYGTYEGHPFRNIITEIEQANMESNKSSLSRVQVGGTLRLLRGLTIDGDYTYSSRNGHFRSVGGPASGINQWTGKLNYMENFQPAKTDMVLYSSDWNAINTGKLYATLARTIQDHAFKVIIGGDIEYFQSAGQSSTRQGLIDAQRGELSLATGDQFVDGYSNHWSTLGYFGRLNYSFKEKYLLELNGRFDGSSRFPVKQQWGFFPSLSAGYIVTNERFMAFAKPVLSFFKLRGSYGSIGNQDVGAYRFLSIMGSSNSNWWVGDKNMLTVGTPGVVSPSLTWETVSTLDFGGDARLFQDQLGVTFDWYKRTTSNMITGGITLPSTFGAAAPAINFGEMQTTGWELALTWNKSIGKEFNLNVVGTLSDFNEKLTKFGNTTNNIYANYEGKDLGEIWGFETDRLFTEDDFVGQDANGKWIPKAGVSDQDDLKGPTAWFSWAPGDVKYKDLNGDGKVTYGSNTVGDHGDLKVIGNSTPHYQYGLRIGADFKGFDFSAFMQGVGKRSDWPSGPIFIPGFNWNEAWYAHQEDYWTPENTNAFYPRPTDQSANNNNLNFRVQTRYLLNMSYLRMKNITLGYTLPKQLTGKVKMQEARLYVSGENLFEFDKLNIPIDPEVDYNRTDKRSFGRVYPYRRTYSFGLQITL